MELVSDGKSEFDRSETSTAPLEATRRRQGRTKLLLSAYAVLFTRYTIATFLSSFFTPLATQMGISGTFNGAIFAAYPLGMAITSVFAPQLIERMGTRRAVFVGLACTGGLTLLFGLAPDLMPPSPGGSSSAAASSAAAAAAAATSGTSGAELLFHGRGAPPPSAPPAVRWLFFFAYLANGLTGALAETACIIMVSARFQDKLGTVMASIGTVSGVGCMVGPVVGAPCREHQARLAERPRLQAAVWPRMPTGLAALGLDLPLRVLPGGGASLAKVSASDLVFIFPTQVGGVLYDLPQSRAWKFRVPFLACSIAPLLLILPLRHTIPEWADFRSEASGGSAPLRSALSLSVVLGLVAVALSGALRACTARAHIPTRAHTPTHATHPHTPRTPPRHHATTPPRHHATTPCSHL